MLLYSQLAQGPVGRQWQGVQLRRARSAMATSLFDGRSAWFSAVRQVLIGCVAAAVTYGVGALIGATMR